VWCLRKETYLRWSCLFLSSASQRCAIPSLYLTYRTQGWWWCALACPGAFSVILRCAILCARAVSGASENCHR
jgi:hypothetical protein